MAKSVFAPFLALMPVVPGLGPALRRRLDGAAVEDHRAWLRHPPVGFPQQHAHIVLHRLENASIHPPSGLLVDRPPRRDAGWQQPPRGTGAHDPAQRMEDLTPIAMAVRGIRSHEGQVGATKAHSSSRTSVGYGLRVGVRSIPQAYQVHNRL
jgi:hypothetical protein